jgi:flagella basal body P-ring formation protein FlgA
MKKIVICPALAIALLLACGLANAEAAVEVKLRERVVPKSSVVRLDDVAEISSADRQQARQLAAVPLMPTPAPDTERYLRKREIADMLAANGVELGDIRFDGAEQVAIAAPAGVRTVALVESSNGGDMAGNRHAAILAGASVTSAKTQTPLDELRANELRDQFGRIIGEYVKVKTGKPDPRRIDCNVTERQLVQLAGATSAPVCDGGNAPWSGRQKFIVSFATADGTVHMPVYADVAAPAGPVVVATRAVARGNVITAADVEVQKIEPNSKTNGQRAVVDSIEKIIGMEARQAIQAGEVVYADQVLSPVLVKRGDLITVVTQSGGIRVRTSARALQDGANGALVQVESLESKQHYDARVVGLREVAVFAPARVSIPQRPERPQTVRRPFTNAK